MPPQQGLGFTLHKVQVHLTSIEKILPVGEIEWDPVKAEHGREFPEVAARTRDSLKRKFTLLYKQLMPTGDPNIPLEVLRVKRIYEEIKKKADMLKGK
jgi:hypothetical protein